MTTNHSEDAAPRKKGLSRRTVVTGTAWAVPAIVVAGPAPHAAATPLPPVTIGGTACKYPGNSGQFRDGIRFLLTITNPNKTDVVLTVDSLTLADGEKAPNISPTTITVTPGTNKYVVIGYPFTNSANTQVTVKYSYTDPATGKVVNGTAGPTTVNLTPAQNCPF